MIVEQINTILQEPFANFLANKKALQEDVHCPLPNHMCFSGHHQMSLWGSPNEQIWTGLQWWSQMSLAGGRAGARGESHVWCPGRFPYLLLRGQGWGGPMSDAEAREALYSEIQCIMGNGHMGTHPGQND